MAAAPAILLRRNLCVCVCYADCEMEGPMPGAVYLLVVLSRGIPSINQPTSASSMDRIGDVP